MTTKQLFLWADEEIAHLPKTDNKILETNQSGLEKRPLSKYLNKHYLPDICKVEGIEEFPCIEPYSGELPVDIVGFDESICYCSDVSSLGIDFFRHDNILERCWNNLPGITNRIRKCKCAIGLDFSPLADGRRCEVVEAIRRNRTSTLYMQRHGVPVIQSASWGNADSFQFVFDGLASNSPTAIEHNANPRDPQFRRLFRRGVEALVSRKNPSILIVVGFELDFDPGVPVKYYKSRIQKLRERHER